MNIYSSQLEQRRRAIVFGDFNIDLLSKNNTVTHYLNIIKETGYEVLNKIHSSYGTRETSTTNTILDHISTNIDNHTFSFSIVDSSLSDHKQLFLEVGNLAPKANKKIHYEALNYESLYTIALNTPYDNDENDYAYLENFIVNLIQRNRIEKIKFLNSPRKDWINKNIIDSINLRNDLWQQTKLNPGDENLCKEYSQQTLKVKQMIKSSKRNYFYSLFSNNKNQPKKMWEVINSLVSNKTKEICTPPKLKLDSGITITEDNLICESFNLFFSSIGAELANKIPNKYHIHTGNTLMYKHDYTHVITLDEIKPCTRDEVSKIIQNLNNNTSTGIDKVTTKAVKCLKDVIAERLVKCINLCLSDGIFPDTIKLVKVSPLYKSGNKTDPNNYRPVSVLPVISKIFERIIYDRLNTYLTEKNFLIDQQYGFRSKSSTMIAAVDLVTKIKTNIDRRNIALGLFIDLKKAFDTILAPGVKGQKLNYDK
ncbi:unnamed protein product [Euphydryas editha]|uniref:Reverse transcriptase domain-containing protein n=1 Tax=Euphydryas editha TaxID=104508 RepID=A0AAU9V969_EUPED|nr:unnamed protein product [Euphydryas editha]